jgi:hypothetical protein
LNRRRTSAIAIIGMVAAVVLAACGSSSKTGSPASAPSPDNTFVLSEFTITTPTNTLHAGSISITADNVGGEVHELVIVRAASATALAMKVDGSVDEDKIAAANKVGEIQQIAARSRQTQTFDLTSGTYVAFCNVIDTMMDSDTTMMNDMGGGTGHVHFARGMHTTFTVQ